jgi:ATP-binding cassette, subfamily C, bacterial
MRQIFKIFLNVEGTKPWLVLVCLLLGGLAEAIGIGSLLPLISTVLSPGTGTPSVFENIVRRVFDFAGLALTFNNMVLLVVGIMFFRSVLLFSAMSYAAVTAARVAIGFRRNLVNAILNARWSYYANQSVGKLANFVSNDATRAGDAYITFATAAACMVQIFAYALVALLINWKVALAGIAGGIAVALASSKLVAISKRTGFKMSERISTLTSELVDMLNNIKALKSMHRYGPILSHIDHVISRLKKAMFAQSFARYGLIYGNDFLVALLVAAGAWVSIVWAGVSVASIFVFGILFFQVISYASKLQKQMQTAAQFHGGYQRIAEGLKEARMEQEAFQGTAKPELGEGITLKDVSFSHGEKLVLDKLSLRIPANSITVIQGPSGAGKTTLLDLLVGFHKPTEGIITIGDKNIGDVNLHQWRGMIGYVPQELALFHDSVTANITLYDETVAANQLSSATALSGVDGFLSALPQGLETDVGEFGGKLSGGQRQRIALARALVHNPKLLILDEVTSALDPETEDAIVNNIAALRGRYTIVAITHRPAWTRIADNLYTLRDGKASLQKTTGKKPK